MGTRPNNVMERTGRHRFSFDDGSGIGGRPGGRRKPAGDRQSLAGLLVLQLLAKNATQHVLQWLRLACDMFPQRPIDHRLVVPATAGSYLFTKPIQYVRIE